MRPRLALACLVACAAAAEPADVAHRFAAAFAKQHLAAFDAIAAAPSVTPAMWPDVAETLDQFLCIELTVVNATPQPGGSLLVTTRATAQPRGNRPLAMPILTWNVTLDERSAIKTAERAERTIANEIASASADERRSIVERNTQLDIELLARTLAELAADPRSPHYGRADLPEFARHDPDHVRIVEQRRSSTERS